MSKNEMPNKENYNEHKFVTDWLKTNGSNLKTFIGNKTPSIELIQKRFSLGNPRIVRKIITEAREQGIIPKSK